MIREKIYYISPGRKLQYQTTGTFAFLKSPSSQGFK